MGDKTEIEWTDATWNPIRGCSRVSEGCRNCYAETMAARFCGEGQPYEGLIRNGKWNGEIMLVPDKLGDPLRWQRPRKIFVNSMSDLFHENVPDEYIDAVFGIMAQASHHTFQVLTKRPERAAAWFERIKAKGLALKEKHRMAGEGVRCALHNAAFEACPRYRVECVGEPVQWPLPNVWLGVSAEDQATACERIPVLCGIDVAVRFVSAEPLLGPIDLKEVKREWQCRDGVRLYDVIETRPAHVNCGKARIDWVIVGGESGPGARPMEGKWARDLRDQCAKHNISYMFKQWGAFNEDGERVGKKTAGRIIDGQTWDEVPKPRR